MSIKGPVKKYETSANIGIPLGTCVDISLDI